MKIKDLKIKCKDNYVLGARLFLPDGEPKAIVQFNSATATPQRFYQKFAEYLVKDGGLAVLTFDYRGIGLSKPAAGLKGFKVAYIEWATKDITDVSDYLLNRFSTIPLLQFGHSVGGQVIGLLSNINKSIGVIAISSAAGSTRHMPIRQQLKSHYFFEIVRPISHLLFGYSKLKKLGIMEDLPKDLVNTWRDWCSVSDYFFDQKYYDEIKAIDAYKNLTIPVEILVPTDDEIATETNVINFWKHAYSSQGISISYLSPADFGTSGIGHFGFFRKNFENTLWPLALQKITKMLKNE
jgi:predicted alpha/beta hydrolase